MGPHAHIRELSAHGGELSPWAESSPPHAHISKILALRTVGSNTPDVLQPFQTYHCNNLYFNNGTQYYLL
jgi:hypothetical protein